MITIEGKEIKHTVDELTVNELEKINSILGRVGSLIEKYFDIFKFLGVDVDTLNNMSLEKLKGYISVFGEKNGTTKAETLEIIEIDGYTYRSHIKEQGVELSARDFKSLENIFIDDSKNKTAMMLAVIFKRVDLSDNEHFTKAHLKYKAKLFGELKSIIALPFIQIVNKELEFMLEQNVG